MEHFALNSICLVHTWRAMLHENAQVTSTSRRRLLHSLLRRDYRVVRALSRACMRQDCAHVAAVGHHSQTNRRVYNTWRGTCRPNLCYTETNLHLYTAATSTSAYHYHKQSRLYSKNSTSTLSTRIPSRAPLKIHAQVADAAPVAPPRIWRYCTSPHRKLPPLVLSRPHHF